VQMHNTAVPCWRVKLRNAICLAFALALTGCSASKPASVPRLPDPAADLMEPAPTGSAVLQRATQHMETWLQMLQGGPTR